MNYNFSNEIKELLKQAGWYEGRRVDISAVKATFNRSAIEFFAIAEEFLEEFNGLTLSSQKKTAFYIDGLKALKELKEDENDDEQIQYLDKILNKKLCPIGVWGDDIILISTDNEIVYLWIWKTVTVSKSLQQLLERYYVDMSSKMSSYSFDLRLEQIPPSWR